MKPGILPSFPYSFILHRQVLVAQPSGNRATRSANSSVSWPCAVKFFCRHITGKGGPELATFQNLFILDPVQVIRIWFDYDGHG